MTNYPYNRNIPGSQNNPSNDQGPMRTNTNSTDSLIAEDHYSFGVTNGGLHKQTRLIDLLNIPPALASGMGTLYTKLATSTSPSTESSLFYSPGATGNQYQLTRTITGKFPQFGTGIQYQAASGSTPALFGGWTFLPGGMLLQYGTLTHNTNALTTITFPVPFTNVPFTVQASGIVTNAADPNQRAAIGINNVTATNFRASTTTNTDLTGIYWMAIGV